MTAISVLFDPDGILITKARHSFKSYIATLMALTALAAYAQQPVTAARKATQPQSEPAEARPGADRLPAIALMAWGNSPSDESQLLGMKEAGLNISGFCQVADLALVRSAGLQCFVSDKRANGYDWEQLPADEIIHANLRSLQQDIGGNPAALGLFLRDEPGGEIIPSLGHVAALARTVLPELAPYVNLFPSQVPANRIQTEDYEAYARLLLASTDQPMLSYDNYSLKDGKMLDRFYTNLEIARKVALDTHTFLWNCILAVAHFDYMEPSDATFNLQVYATLAYGGRGIQYFTYFAPQVGNYRLAAVDQFGNRTASWDAMRRINLQVRELAPTLAQLHSTGVFHYPDVPPGGHPLAESKYVQSVNGLDQSTTAGILVGEFNDEQGRPYMMIVNKDLVRSFNVAITLRKPYQKLLRISPYSGKEDVFGGEQTWLAPGAGVLLRVE